MSPYPKKDKKDYLKKSFLQANISNIIYINRDTEPEGHSEGLSLFNAFKRFKRNSSEVDGSLNEKFKSWMVGVKGKSASQTDIYQENNFFHQTKNFGSKNVSISFLFNFVISSKIIIFSFSFDRYSMMII